MDPDVPLVVAEVNPDAGRPPRKGIIANPNCTTMAAMPVLAPARRGRAGRLVAATYQAVSGAGLAGVDELDDRCTRWRIAAPELTFDGGAVDVPGPRVPPADRVQRAAAGRLDRRRRLGRDRRGAEAAQRDRARSWGSPTCGSPAPASGCRSSPATRCRSTPVRPPLSVGPRARAPGHRPWRRADDVPTPLQAAGQDPSFVGRIRRTRPSTTGWRCSSQRQPRKGAALNAVQIAELLPP